jgi:hypothetical protein
MEYQREAARNQQYSSDAATVLSILCLLVAPSELPFCLTRKSSRVYHRSTVMPPSWADDYRSDAQPACIMRYDKVMYFHI